MTLGSRDIALAAVAVGLAAALWHGGFYPAGQWLFVAASVAAAISVVLAGPAATAWPVQAGLGLVAAANLFAYWRSPDGDLAAALVTLALLAFAAAIAAHPAGLAVPVLACIVGVAATAACTGVLGVLTHSTPLAERISGLWRAGGTFEYPPALGLVCVCGLAALAALHGDRRVDGTTAGVLGAIIVAGLAASYDRTSVVEAVVVVALFGWRLPETRRLALIAGGAIALVGAAAVAIGLSHRHGLGLALGHGLFSSRTETLSDAWRGFTHRPWAGYGPGRFADLYRGEHDPTQTNLAHNAVLEQAVEAGFAAAAGILLVLISGLVAACRRLVSRRPVELGWAVIGVVVLASALYDFTWSYPPIALIGVAAAVLCQAAMPAGTNQAGSSAH